MCEDNYVYIATTICSICVLILSEVLPFTSTQGNGLVHGIVKILSNRS